MAPTATNGTGRGGRMPRRTTVNRAPITPRKIRDIRPKRQLRINSEKKREINDDDWWYSADDTGGEEKAAHLRGVAAVNRFGRRPFSLARDSVPLGEDESHARRSGVFAVCQYMIRMYENIRQTPRQKRRKRLFWVVILISALKSIYFAELDQYTFHDSENLMKRSSKHVPLAFASADDEFSPLGVDTRDADDIPSPMFGYEPKVGFDSNSDKTGLRDPGIGSMGDNFFGRQPLGAKSFSLAGQSDSISSFPHRESKSMAESIGGFGSNELGDYGTAHTKSNGMNSMKSHASGPYISKVESKLSQPNGDQQRVFSSYQQPKDSEQFHGLSSNRKDQFQGLRGANPIGNSHSWSMMGGEYNDVNIQMPSKNQQSFTGMGQEMNGHGSSLSMSKVTTFDDSRMIESMQAPATYQKSIDNFLPLAQNKYDGDNVSSGTNDFSLTKDQHKILSEGDMSFTHMRDSRSNPYEKRENRHPVPGASHGSARALDCANYGGPFLESESEEVVYWRNIPTDSSFTSPYYNPQAQEPGSASFWNIKYLTFEMDDAGWNNMRLGFENMILLAHSMGRTLVMPPRRQIAHGMFDKSGSKLVSFSDFYDISTLNSKQQGLNVITMEQFLEREALNGHLKSRDGESIYPPQNNIKWDNQRLDLLWNYIRDVTKTFQWNPKQCVLAFPSAGTDDQHLFDMMTDVLAGKDGRPFPDYTEYQGRPVMVNAPPIERFREVLAGRSKICMYDRKIHEESPVVHFKADPFDGTRLITQFYAFVWFEDWRHDLWSKRFIRDNLRYNDEIMCVSARIISALRKHARDRFPGNIHGEYDAVHIRRGDFQKQFPMTEMDPTEILAELKEEITTGSTIFIATNEREFSFFRSLQEEYDVKFLGDFGSMLSDINPNYFPMIEQVIASRSRVFFGTFFSSFSAYIARLRGYHSVKESHEGHMTGMLHNTFFFPKQWKKELTLYQAVHKPFFGRDFPVAWRDIDRLELPTVYNNKLG